MTLITGHLEIKKKKYHVILDGEEFILKYTDINLNIISIDLCK